MPEKPSEPELQPSPRDRHVIREVEQVRALRTPARQQILGAIQELGRCSVSELAEAVGWKPESVYYHVKELLAAGLVVRAGERAGSRRPEALYEPLAREVVVDRSIRSPAFLRALWDAYRAVLRACERNLERALRGEAEGEGPRRDTAVRQWTVRMMPTELTQLETKIEELDRFIAENSAPDSSDYFSLTLVWSRRHVDR